MSDPKSEYWQEFVSPSGELVFVAPADAGGGCVFLSRADRPTIANDRDRALLRAYLTLALRRLDEQESEFALGLMSLRPSSADTRGEEG